MASTLEELTGPAAIDPGIEDLIANSAHNRENPPPADQTMIINMGPQHPSTHGVLRLVIEVDGGQHSQSESDKKRDADLRVEGFRIVRYWNTDVLKNPDGVLTDLLVQLEGK